MVIDNSSCWRYDPEVPLSRAGSERACARRIYEPQDAAEHHRQSELLDRPARRGAEAPARPRQDQARRGRDLSVGVGRRQGGHGRIVEPDQGHLRHRCAEPKKFTKQIAFNVIPHIDVFMEDGYTKEEWKMTVETKKILDPKIKLTATCVRVPVFVGHSEAVNIEFERPIIGRGSARDPARGAGRARRRQARGRRLCDAGRMRRRFRHLRVAHPRGLRRSRTGSICGSSPTICARVPRSTRCRSPKP